MSISKKGRNPFVFDGDNYVWWVATVKDEYNPGTLFHVHFFKCDKSRHIKYQLGQAEPDSRLGIDNGDRDWRSQLRASRQETRQLVDNMPRPIELSPTNT